MSKKYNNLQVSFPNSDIFGSSLMAECLGFQAFIAVARVQSLVGELRSCKLHSAAKKNKKRKKRKKQ